MNNTYKLIPKIVLWLLILAGIGVVGLFFFGGDLAEGHEVAGDILPIPTYSDVLLYLAYALVALVILVTLVFNKFLSSFILVILGFVLDDFRVYRKTELIGVLKTSGVAVAAVVLCWLCWHLGSDAKVEIIGYEGDENVGFMARLTDAIMYLTYILTGATVVTLVFGAVYSKIKK